MPDHHDLLSLIDKGHTVYEICKAPIYLHSNNRGDVYTDPVLQVQAFSDTNRLPLKVTQKFAPIKKLKLPNTDIHRWSYGAGYSASSDIETLLAVFKLAGYPIILTEPKTDPFGMSYTLYYVANIGERP